MKSGTLSATKSPKTVTVSIFNATEHMDSSDEDEWYQTSSALKF